MNSEAEAPVAAVGGGDEAGGVLSKTERRRAARQRKRDAALQEKIAKKRAKNEAKKRRRANRDRNALGDNARPKMSYEDRRERYLKNAGFDVKKLKGKKCFRCLGTHMLKDCPERGGGPGAGGGGRGGMMCFNCGSNEHSLGGCSKAVDMRNLPYASCFLCKQQGHITRFCPNNENGIFKNGGACHVCGEKTHLSKDCPERAAKKRASTAMTEDGTIIEGVGVVSDKTKGDDDPGLEAAAAAAAGPKKKKVKRAKTVKF
mmetsp:Transcript_11782/g.35772  ORF Transcript_11782/g.35772 Transcript_11782/m.35772 type:complete len:259 (-) Transcript_11782:105-881(-)